MKIINLTQREDDWLEWRRQGITASDAVILLGQSKYKTAWRLWAEKTGYAREVDLSLNPLVRHGIENEDNARQAFEVKYNDILLPVCIESLKYPFMRASLDGLRNNGEPVELKCPSDSTWADVRANRENSEAYKLYYYQVQHQIFVTNVNQGWLVFYSNGQIEEFLIQRDDHVIQQLLAAAGEFLSKVKKRIEPPKDPEKDLYIPTGDDVFKWSEVAGSYRIYDAEVQKLKERLTELQGKQKSCLERMKLLMGEFFHADYCGVMVTRYKVAGKVNYVKLLEEKAANVSSNDIEQYREGSSERCRVTICDSISPRNIVDSQVLADLHNVTSVQSLYF